MPIEEWSDDIWIVHLAEEPALSDDLVSVRNRVHTADQPPHVVLNFAAIRGVNSSNLSQMLRLRKVLVERETRLRLAAPQDSVWAVFLTTGLDKVFEFAPDVPTALAQLQLGGT